MTPEECATIRSIARWVLPVLVGPSTAVTPKPGARPSEGIGAIEEKGMLSNVSASPTLVASRQIVYHNATPRRSQLKFWNESGTNRARIGDSHFCGGVHRNIWIPYALSITRSRLTTVSDVVESGRAPRPVSNRNETSVK